MSNYPKICPMNAPEVQSNRRFTLQCRAPGSNNRHCPILVWKHGGRATTRRNLTDLDQGSSCLFVVDGRQQRNCIKRRHLNFSFSRQSPVPASLGLDPLPLKRAVCNRLVRRSRLDQIWRRLAVNVDKAVVPRGWRVILVEGDLGAARVEVLDHAD